MHFDRALDPQHERETYKVNKCMRLLKVMILAYRALNLIEVTAVTGLTDGDLEVLVNRCSSFHRRQANNIEFVH